MPKNSDSSASTETDSSDGELHGSLLDEALISWRTRVDGTTRKSSLPELLAALAQDEVRDFPALRPHQRHPWHAFLTQLSAIALHHAGHNDPWKDAGTWREALLALTPADPDGAAWCLVSPPNRPALLQAAVPDWNPLTFGSVIHSPDSLDMVSTSKNHDLKSAINTDPQSEDWIYALISLQTQSPSDSGSHKGIARMNGGWGRRVGVGIKGSSFGSRWLRDTLTALRVRDRQADTYGLSKSGGISLVWTIPWDGISQISFSALDPLFVEICRRVRLVSKGGSITALKAKTPIARINQSNCGMTGDLWTPVDSAKGESVTIRAQGINYKLAADLLNPKKLVMPPASELMELDGKKDVRMIASSLGVGSKNVSAGFYERTIPISPKMQLALRTKSTDLIAKIADYRINTISEIKSIIIQSLLFLFQNGVAKKEPTNSEKDKSYRYSVIFEINEDARFFSDLIEEIESLAPATVREQWLLDLVDRAEAVIKAAFIAGPRSGIQRYKAQSAALNRFHGSLRQEQDARLPELARLLRERGQTSQVFTGEGTADEPN